MDDRIYTDDVKTLCEALAGITDPKSIFNLLTDVCTIREIQDLAQRLLVAKLLDQGVTYSIISKQTGASATTIARVSKELKYGSGGYRIALDIISPDEDALLDETQLEQNS